MVAAGHFVQLVLLLLLQASNERYVAAIEAGEGYTAICSLAVLVVVVVARVELAGSRSASEQADRRSSTVAGSIEAQCVRAVSSDSIE